MQPDEQKPLGVEPAPASTPPPPQPTQTVQPAPVVAQAANVKRPNKNVLIGVIVAAVVVVAAIAWGVYAMVANSPENLMKAAVHNLSKEKAVAATFKMVDGKAQDSIPVTGDVAFSIDPANDKNAQILFGLGSGNERFGLNALMLDGTAYLKFSGAQSLGPLLGGMDESTDMSAASVAMFAQMLGSLNDQWIELEGEQVQAATGSNGAASAVTASPQDAKKALELYDRHPFIKVDKTYADEVVDGVNTAHFSVKFDKNTYVAYLRAVKDANLATIKITDQDIEQAQAQTELTADQTIELWIARDNKTFKQVRAINLKEGEEFELTLTVAKTLPSFGTFEKPANAKPFSEIIITLLGGSNAIDLDAINSSELLLTQ